MRALRALAVNAVRASFRNRVALFFTLGLAVLFMIIFGELFGGGRLSVTIGVVDQDHSAQSASLSRSFGSVDGVTVEHGSLAAEQDSLKHSGAAVVVVIPAGYGAAVLHASSLQSPFHLRVLQSAQASTTTAIGYQIVQQVVGVNVAQTTHVVPPVVVGAPETVSTNPLSEVDFLLPSMIAYIVLQSGVNYVAIGLAELRERKVLRRFRATPVTPGQILGGQVAGGVLTVLLQVIVLVAMGLAIFRARVYGSWAVAAVPILLGTAAFVGIGFLLTAGARNAQSARGLASMVAFPMMFLSGIFFPVTQLPGWLQGLVHILPLTWLSDALHQVMNDGVGLGAVWLDCVVLTAWAIATMAIATWRFRWD